VSFLCAEPFVFLTETIIHRDTRNANPAKWDADIAKNGDINYSYSKTTSTTCLRPHIENYHLKLYLLLAQKHGWKHSLPGLVSQARSKAASDASGSRVRRGEFTEERFHEHLINFIVADDQVRDLWSFLHSLRSTCSELQGSEHRGMSRI